MKQCTGLWIVAPITRAVDDKATKNPLGETFRRQLKFDGTYSAVTFICSKTDDISITEAIGSLELQGQMEEFDDEFMVWNREQREVKNKIKKLKGDKEDLTDASEEAEENLEKWEALKDKVEDGESVYSPTDSSNKRKRLAELDQNSSTSFDGSPLTTEQIDQEINDLRQVKKDARRQRGAIDAELKELNARSMEIEAKLDAIDAKKSATCIAGRNRYSKTAIQQDFAAGIREMDNENQEEENPDDFDPEDEVRDYQKVAESLPVFCVSSRAYQKLSGRMVKVSINNTSSSCHLSDTSRQDSDVPGFTSVEETEIPQLQAHCAKLTEAGRAAACRRFLNSVTQLCNSLAMWASDDATGKNQTDKDNHKEIVFLEAKLGRFAGRTYTSKVLWHNESVDTIRTAT